MLISKKPLNDSNFSFLINQNLIKKSECVKYLGVYLDNKLSWRTHIDKICKKVSKVCGMIYKLRYYVPLSTLKIVYFSLFHSHIQYSLLNWGRASKSILYKLKILQSKILRAMLFCSKQDQTNLLYFKLKILKLEDMIAMEYAKFIFKFNNKYTTRMRMYKLTLVSSFEQTQFSNWPFYSISRRPYHYGSYDTIFPGIGLENPPLGPSRARLRFIHH